MPGPDEAGLSSPSRRWLAGTDLKARKRRGQYLTPRPVADALVDRVELSPGMEVLDPGAGTGELLAAVAWRCPEARLTGWDIDQTALAAASELVPGARLELRSALEPPDPGAAGCGGFDLVIGNPPYFQVPVTPGLKDRFGEVISGRANIFALFFQAGLDLLRPGGTLAYVVPPSMNSGAYFEALREHIVSRAQISDLTVLEGTGIFEGANTAAQLLVMKRAAEATPADGRDAHVGMRAGRFVFERRDVEAGFRRVVFSPAPQVLAEGFEGRRTLWQLGYEAVTGTVVWNQHRAELKKRQGIGTVPLFWSADLRGGVLDPQARPGTAAAGGGRRARARPGFIRSERALRGPALLVNRVVGSVGRGCLRSALVPAGLDFVAENHVNVVRPRPDAAQLTGWDDLQARIEDPATAGRLRLLTGNTQISATELTHLLPI